MLRDDVLQVLGSPQSSGYPEKIAETWSLNGFLGLRRLVIWYDRDGKAEQIVEGIHWRPSQRYIIVRRLQ